MSDATVKAVRFSREDLAIVQAAQVKLGCRSASEVLRMGLRSLQREQGLVVANENNREKSEE